MGEMRDFYTWAHRGRIYSIELRSRYGVAAELLNLRRLAHRIPGYARRFVGSIFCDSKHGSLDIYVAGNYDPALDAVGCQNAMLLAANDWPLAIVKSADGQPLLELSAGHYRRCA